MEGMAWIHLAQDMDKWETLINMVRKVGFHKMQGIS